MLASFRALVGRAIIAGFGLRYVDELPGRRPSGIVLGAPHTSLVDGILLLALIWRSGLDVRALIEQRFLGGPYGRVLRVLGAVAVDRANPVGLVEEFTALVGQGQFLFVAPEGTRSPRDHWKSGFYRIARAADVPVSLGYIDMRTRTVGLGPAVTLTGDLRVDMDRVRAFYVGKRGWRPGNESQVRLRAETVRP